MAIEQSNGIRTCKQCGINISHRHGVAIFCSEKCFNVFHGRHKQRTIFNCLCCGVDISDRHANVKYCSGDCKSEARKKVRRIIETPEQRKKWRETAKLRGYVRKSRTPRTQEQKAKAAERARARRATPEGREKYRKIIKAFKQRQKQNNPDAWREQRYKEASERRAKQAERNGKKYNPRGQGNPTGFGIKYEYYVEKAYDRIIKRNAYDAFNWWFAKKSDAEVIAWYEAMGKPWLNPRLSDAEQWKLKYRLCPEFTINERLRRQIKKVGTNDGIADLIRQALKRNGKSSKVEILLGYSISDLRVHIERQFTKRMSWGKFMQGEIHIDHIIPKAVFDLSDYDQWRVCWDLPNLRPMWAKDNLKKRDKVLNLL